MGPSLQPSVVAVTCLAFEARIAAAARVTILCAARRNGLAGSIETAIARGCGGIISFGVAGGLDPHLRPGDWVVASHVIAKDGRYPADARWCRRLCEALPSAIHAGISGIDEPMAQPAEKARLRAQHGTVAADTESHVAAQVAAAHGIPFVAARVILDPAHRALPPAALLPLCPDGSPDLGAIARSVRAAPRQVGALGRLAADAICAQSTLLRGSRCLGEALAFVSSPAVEANEVQEHLTLADAELPVRCS